MPNANGLALRPPMRCLRLGGTPQTSAPAALQAVDPVENAGGPLTSRGCEPLAMAAKHRGRLGVGHKQAWRGFHPQEWQLASLHQHSLPSGRYLTWAGLSQAGSHQLCGWRTYSITSSARARREGGIVRPSAFAIVRLIANSYFVGAWTGRLAGFSPLRMRSPGEQDRTRLLGYRAVPSPYSCFNGAITSPSAA